MDTGARHKSPARKSKLLHGTRLVRARGAAASTLIRLPTISVIICSNDAAEYAQVTANYASRLSGYPHEIIGIHDARSLSEGYNRGTRRAAGDLLGFSHDD